MRIFHKEGFSARLKRILGTAVPNGVEQGIFQFVKVALSSIIALFGTYQIAANGIALAMSFDWCVRAVAFYIRFRGGKWKKYQLILDFFYP